MARTASSQAGGRVSGTVRTHERGDLGPILPVLLALPAHQHRFFRQLLPPWQAFPARVNVRNVNHSPRFGVSPLETHSAKE